MGFGNAMAVPEQYPSAPVRDRMGAASCGQPAAMMDICRVDSSSALGSPLSQNSAVVRKLLIERQLQSVGNIWEFGTRFASASAASSAAVQSLTWMPVCLDSSTEMRALACLYLYCAVQ